MVTNWSFVMMWKRIQDLRHTHRHKKANTTTLEMNKQIEVSFFYTPSSLLQSRGKKLTFSHHLIPSFHSQIAPTRYDFFTTTENAIMYHKYSLFLTPKFWINVLFRSSLSLSKILEWPTKSIIVWYLIFSSCQILRVNNSFHSHDAEVYASTAFSCIETFTCNGRFYESENFSDFSIHHIFESGNKRFSFSTKIS